MSELTQRCRCGCPCHCLSLSLLCLTRVACVLSLTVALTPSIRAPLVAPFLCPVLAMLVCGPSVGASVRTGWQVIKGALYAAAFGFTTYRTRGGKGIRREDRWMRTFEQCARRRVQCKQALIEFAPAAVLRLATLRVRLTDFGIHFNHDTTTSRALTTVLLFSFSVWAKYCIGPGQLTTKKLAAGLNCTILITQLNYDTAGLQSFKLLATACLGSLAGVLGSMLPIPHPALHEVGHRFRHALVQSSHLVQLLIEAFCCTSSGQLQSRMLRARIEHSLAQLQDNREAIRQRLKEAEYERPVHLYHWVFGTPDSDALARLLQHVHTLDHMVRYLRCMAFAFDT